MQTDVPNHEFRIGERSLVLKTNGNQAELWCRDLRLPETAQQVPQALASKGAVGAAQSSVVARTRCGTLACVVCEAVDGVHCSRCIRANTRKEVSEEVLNAPIGVELAGHFGGPLAGLAAAASETVDKRIRSPGRKTAVKVVLALLAVLGIVLMGMLRSTSGE